MQVCLKQVLPTFMLVRLIILVQGTLAIDLGPCFPSLAVNLNLASEPTSAFDSGMSYDEPPRIQPTICRSGTCHVWASSIPNVVRISQSPLCHVTHKASLCRTRFSWWGKPSNDKLLQLFEAASPPPGFNHDCVGMTHPVTCSSSLTAEKDSFNKKGRKSLSTRSKRSEDFWIPDAMASSISGSDTAKEQKESKYKWREIRIKKATGRGRNCYEAVRDAVLSWERTLPIAEDKDVTSTRPHKEVRRTKPFWAYIRLLNRAALKDSIKRSTAIPSLQFKDSDRMVVTISRAPIPLLNLWTYNPCQVIYDIVDERWNNSTQPNQDSTCLGLTYTSTAYATLKGHLLSGEERVTVALHDPPSSKVEVEVLSYSRPTKSILGRLIFPLIKKTQKRFFNDQVETLAKIGRDAM